MTLRTVEYFSSIFFFDTDNDARQSLGAAPALVKRNPLLGALYSSSNQQSLIVTTALQSNYFLEIISFRIPQIKYDVNPRQKNYNIDRRLLTALMR